MVTAARSLCLVNRAFRRAIGSDAVAMWAFAHVWGAAAAAAVREAAGNAHAVDWWAEYQDVCTDVRRGMRAGAALSAKKQLAAWAARGLVCAWPAKGAPEPEADESVRQLARFFHRHHGLFEVSRGRQA